MVSLLSVVLVLCMLYCVKSGPAIFTLQAATHTELLTEIHSHSANSEPRTISKDRDSFQQLDSSGFKEERWMETSFAAAGEAMATDTASDFLADQLPASLAQSADQPVVQPTVQPSLAPFYDPVDDDKNEEWALKQRQGRKSDAVLTCPACLATLCIDCQRHELYVNQYRAMFVRNCTTVETERLRYSDNKKRKRNARRKSRVQEEDIPAGGPGMIRVDPKDVKVGEVVFKPVRCAECGAEVAVLDSDEVYHFFDAIPTFS